MPRIARKPMFFTIAFLCIFIASSAAFIYFVLIPEPPQPQQIEPSRETAPEPAAPTPTQASITGTKMEMAQSPATPVSNEGNDPVLPTSNISFKPCKRAEASLEGMNPFIEASSPGGGPFTVPPLAEHITLGPQGPAAAPTPEPGTVILAVSGLASAVALLRRRMRARE